MHEQVQSAAERFDAALFVTMQNLGPQLISRAQQALTPGQVFMLHFISKEQPCSVSKLAEKMEVNPSAITVMLDRLESNGFVVRVRDTADRRVVNVQLTKDGVTELADVMKVRTRITQHCLSQIEPDQLEGFLQIFEQLARISAAMDIKAIISRDNTSEGSHGSK